MAIRTATGLWARRFFELKEVTIDVWAVAVDQQDIQTMKDDPSMKLAVEKRTNNTPKHLILETVEAELVLLIHQNHHHWPKYQMEIHFHQTSDRLREKAVEIFEQYRGQQCPTV